MNTTNKGPSFRELIQGGGFAYGAELVTTRGFAAPEQPNKIVELGAALAADPRIGWLSLTDNPGGNTMLPPDWLARMLAGKGTPLVIHLTCKDLNRNALEARAWQFAAEGFENIVAMTGDYPKGGAAPVFDLDSVSLVALLRSMNDGIPVPSKNGEKKTLPKTNFHIGCVVSPFKRHERELMPQYFKLLRKISSGAQYVYTQLGYDMRKFHEVRIVLADNGYHIPVIGNVYLLNKTVLELFHRGQVPGCVVSDKLYKVASHYTAGPDKGRSFFLELAAKQLAAFKGLGFAGGYIGGISKAETYFELINLAESCGKGDWLEFAKEIQYPQDDEFYLFERDEKTGLGDPERLNQQYLKSLGDPQKSTQVTVGYRLSRFVHDKVFTPDTPGFKLMQRIYRRFDKNPGSIANATRTLEKMSKMVWFGCKECGDCSLPETGYLCPLVACSKGARNGPCGGSADGNCELADKECIWARAYERMKQYGETGEMLRGPAVFTNAQLRGTSSWANTFLGRDHHAVKKPAEAGSVASKSKEAPASPQPKSDNGNSKS